MAFDISVPLVGDIHNNNWGAHCQWNRRGSGGGKNTSYPLPKKPLNYFIIYCVYVKYMYVYIYIYTCADMIQHAMYSWYAPSIKGSLVIAWVISWVAWLWKMGEWHECHCNDRKVKYPPVNIQKAIENGPFIVSFPIKNGDFPWLC